MAGKGIQIVVGAEYNGKDLDRAARDVEKLRRQTQSTSDKFKEFGAGLSSVGKSLTVAVTLPLAAIGAAAVAASVQFESSMSKITGLVGIAADEVAGMRDGVLAMAGDTARAPQELADALFVVTSAGLRGEEAMSALNSASMAATAGLGQTSDIARALAGVMNAYGSDVLGAAEATDVIVATARAGNFETSQFAAAIGRVLPFAKQAQASFADMGGAVALLTRTNGDAAQSVTQMTALFRAFVVPTAEATKSLSNVGLSAEMVRDSIGEQGLVATLQMLDEALGGNREQLGRLLGSSEAAAAAFQILDADAATLESTFGEVNSAAGITEEAFGVVAETTGFKLQKAMANFKTVLIEIGDVIAPLVQQVSDFATRMLQAFRALPEGTKTFIVALAGVAAAIGPILLIAGKATSAIGALMASFTGVGGFAGIAAAVTGPVGIVIAAIVGLIAIIVAMWRESEVFRTAVANAFNQVKDAVSGAVDTISGALASNGEAIDTLRGIFKALGDFIGTFIIPIWGTYLSGVIKVVSVLLAGWIQYMGMLLGAFRSALPYVLNFAAEVSKGIGNMVDFVLGGLETLIDGLATALGWVPGIGDALNAARDSVRDFRNGVREAYNGVEQGLRNAATSVEQWGDQTVAAHSDYQDAAVRSRSATQDYADAAVRASDAASGTRSNLELLADVTDATAAATAALTDAYGALSAFFSETRAIDRAHTLLQDFQTQVASNSAGFDEMTDAAKANRSAFMDWADSQIAAAQKLTDPIERMEALKEVQRTARDALREQGIDPKTSGFYQEIKGTVDAAKEAVDGMDDAVATAEEGGLNVASAIAKGITQGMTANQSAMNAAGLAGGQTVIDGLNTGAGVASPSKFAITAGREVGAGMIEGLNQMSLSIRANGDLAGRTLIQGMINGLDSGSGSLYAKVRAIVAAALAAARSAAGAGASSSSGDPTTDVARGGLIRGRGGPMADMIPAMLSNGEFVIRAQAVNTFGPGFFDALNRGVNPMQGMEAPRTSDAPSSGGRSLVIQNLNVTSAPDERAEQSVPRALRRLSWVSGLNG